MSDGNHKNGNGAAQPRVRCAIYTRKSTSEGLDQDFNTLDAQREAAEHYIQSQATLGWEIIETRYDDGGYTGGNLERPALQHLVDDIERGLVDMVVVYKVDRLSRSLLDFGRVMERFERRNVGFVSITQSFDTSTSMGRLVLNVLLSFAQFERELISERTRDKILAARRRGKWTGGRVVLGYKINPESSGLEVDPVEAELVRLVFDLYLRHHSIVQVAERLNALGHKQKRYVSKGGKVSGGRKWSKNPVHSLLRNPLYIGKIRGKDGETHLGVHEPIISLETFEKVAAIMNQRTTGKKRLKRRGEYLLTGLLRCGPCDAGMTSAVANGNNGTRYRYYRCVKQQNDGTRCTTGLLRVDEIEKLVIDQVREVAKSGIVRDRIMKRMFGSTSKRAKDEATRDHLKLELKELGDQAEALIESFRETSNGGGKLLARGLGKIEQDMDRARLKLGDIESHIHAVDSACEQGRVVADLLETFDDIWGALLVEERRELLHLLIKSVTVDIDAGDLRVVFRDLTADLDDAGDDPPAGKEVATPLEDAAQ